MNDAAAAGGRMRGLVLMGAIGGAGFLAALDTTVVGVVLPEIGRDLRLALADLQWVGNAYSLAFVACLMTGGALADRFGRRLAFVVGLGLFAAASLGCGVAPNGLLLHISRAVQGIGAAVMMSASIAVLAHAYQDKAARAAAFGVWGTAVGLAVAAGPVIGGALAAVAGWRWVFLVNLPVGGALIAATLWAATESSDPEAKRLDFSGAILFAAAIGVLIYALVAGNAAHWSLIILALLAGALALLAVFAVIEARQPRPMMDVALFRRPDFIGVCLSPIATSVSFWSLFILLPLYLRGKYDLSALGSGLALAPLALPMLGVPTWAQRRLAPVLSTRLFLGGGLAVITGGTGIAALGVYVSSLVVAALGLLVTGIGAAAINAENANAAVSRVPVERSGMASGIAGTMRQLGFGLGIAGLGAVLQAFATASLAHHAAQSSASWRGQVDALASRITTGDVSSAAAMVPTSDRGDFAAIARQSLDAGFAAMLFAAALVAAFSAAAVLVLLSGRADRPAPASGK